MNSSPLRLSFAALALVALPAISAAQSSSSSTTTTTTRSSTTTTTPNAATSTTASPTRDGSTLTTRSGQAQTAPDAVTRRNAPFAPPPVTQAVPGAVVPPVQTPAQGPQVVTEPARPTAPGVVVQPPGSTNASTMLDANGQRIVVSGASIDALAAAGVEVAVDPQNALANLRRADASGQQGVTAEIQTRVDATNRALTEARAQSRANGLSLSEPQLDQALAEVRLREDMIRETLRNAAISNSEAEWRQLQSVLDSQYAAYADAVLRAYGLMQPPPRG